MEETPIRATMARQVLDDCHDALAELRAKPAAWIWRRRWVTMVTLLRTVRDALFREDGGLDRGGKPDRSKPVNPHLMAAILEFRDRMGREKQNIYNEFILREANNILHEYKFDLNKNVNVTISGVVTIANPPPNYLFELQKDPDNVAEHAYQVKSGLFEGTDSLVLAEQAVQWWSEQLNRIEAEAARLSRGAPSAETR